MIERFERTVTAYRARCRFCPAKGPAAESHADAGGRAEAEGWDGHDCCPRCSERIGRELAQGSARGAAAGA